MKKYAYANMAQESEEIYYKAGKILVRWTMAGIRVDQNIRLSLCSYSMYDETAKDQSGGVKTAEAVNVMHTLRAIIRHK